MNQGLGPKNSSIWYLRICETGLMLQLPPHRIEGHTYTYSQYFHTDDALKIYTSFHKRYKSCGKVAIHEMKTQQKTL